MIKPIEDNFSPDDFNMAAAHPLQSWQWGEARKKMGTEVVRFGEFEHGNLKNVFQMSLHPIPYTGLRLGYLPRSVIPGKDAIEYFAGWAKKNRILFVKMEPYAQKSESAKSFSDPRIVVSKTPLFTSWTQILDITKKEDELMAAMHHKTRYNIRLASKKGVTVKLADDDNGFETFAKLYFETTKRQRYYGHNLHYHRTVWENLKNGIAHIMVAYFNDVPLAAYELFYFKKKLYYTYGGTSDEYRNLMASNLLMWEAIRFGKKLGAEKFDMWGSLPPDYDPSDPWAGFTRFKQGYGTEFVRMVESHDLVSDFTVYQGYNLVYKIRESLLALKQKLS